MDNISINKANRLYWLGRYTERVYTMIDYLSKFYDHMVDKDESAYLDFCNRLGIPQIYNNKNDFIKNFISDKKMDFSLVASLDNAYANAVVLRDILTSRTLSYIQLASNDLMKCVSLECRIFDLHRVTDDLIAFWGAVDDYIVENNVRDLIKAGKYAERVELYTRFSAESDLLKCAVQRLTHYVKHLEIDCNCSDFPDLIDAKGELNLISIECYINELFK